MFVNPDGPEAADEIERLRQENAEQAAMIARLPRWFLSLKVLLLNLHNRE